MSVLQFHKVSKYFADLLIIDQASFSINHGEKVALAGINGSGKTTIFNIISGIYEPDEGNVFIASGYRLGYSEQQLDLDPEAEIFDYVLSGFAEIIEMRKQLLILEQKMQHMNGAELEQALAEYGEITEAYEKNNGYAIEAQSRRILSGLGFKKHEFYKPCKVLSGGEQRRLSLACLLVSEPDILLLDEPTNHLDLPAIEWLEEYLQSYSGTVLIISHDRYFLDKTVCRILEISQKKIVSYPGNYSVYEHLKAEREASDKKAFEKQQKDIQSVREYITKYKAGIKSKQARGREKQLARLELLSDVFKNRPVRISFSEAKATGKEVLKAENLYKTIHPGLVLQDISFLMTAGQRIGMIGENGTGKTSLLKTLHSQTQDRGILKWGSNVKVSFFDQQHAGLHGANTVFQEIASAFAMPVEKIKKMLAAVGFADDDLDKKIGMLSGGEKSRVAFVKMILEEPNVLLLDEPTNHLDLESKEIITRALLDFEGTILFVSHDRFLLDVLATDLMIVKEGRVSYFNGNYTEYLEQQLKDATDCNQEKPVQNRNDSKSAEKKSPGINEYKVNKRVAELEKIIEELEIEQKNLQEALHDPQNHKEFQKTSEMAEQLHSLDSRLCEAVEEWAALLELLETKTTKNTAD